MRLSPLPTLSTVPRTGVWYRALSPVYYPDSVLQLDYTIHHASRFYAGPNTPPTYQTLYLAQSPEIALREIEALYGPTSATVANLRAVTLFALEVRVQRLIDLTDPNVQMLLQTTVQELTGDWRIYAVLAALATPPAPAPIAPTQQLGVALFTLGVEGFLAPSAKAPALTSLVLFPQNLQSSSFVRHTHPATGQVYQIP